MDPCLGYVNAYIWTPNCHVMLVRKPSLARTPFFYRKNVKNLKNLKNLKKSKFPGFSYTIFGKKNIFLNFFVL